MAEAKICEVKTTLNSGPCTDAVTGVQKNMQLLK
jgi:hypothetical protein